MNVGREQELANTRKKLRLLEESYEEARHDTEDGEHVRELELQSLKRLINQLKDEIVRYESRQGRGVAMRRVLNDVELVNTRRKLSELERLYEAHERETDGDQDVREISRESLKRMINQLKEEIIWTEVHPPTPSEAARS